ncbi:MAG: bifunctional serine/threonine-protein kinase/formylglycine-generating enzyme family protein [Nevskia sp.]|nr:bifunctional serine/threonine-protein kinase/formylglycine-generating enzyme family protein [Nevskia sp.]
MLRKVAIKEYFPQGIASRENGHTVSPTHEVEGATEAFGSGLRAFYKEAQAIAELDHENVIRLLSVFQSNGTAYFIMPYVKGESLRALLRREGTLAEERARRLLLPVLEGLAHAHARGILHRDIKPDNIMLREDDGRPVLIDFGTARAQTASDATQYTRMTDLVAYTPGYAALEQYSRAASENRHGPWTDLYAFGALLYEAVTGKAPPEAALRAAELGGGHADPLLPASALLRDAPGYGRAFLLAIDWALELSARDRPQNIVEFRAALDGRRLPPEATLARVEARGASVEQLTIGPGAAVTAPNAATPAWPAATTAERSFDVPGPPSVPSQPFPPAASATAPPTRPPGAATGSSEAPADGGGSVKSPGRTVSGKRARLAAALVVMVIGVVAGGIALNSRQPVPAPVAPSAAAGNPEQAALARKARDDASILLKRAGDVIRDKGGQPDDVLRDALALMPQADQAMAKGHPDLARTGYEKVAALTRSETRGFFETLIASYSKIAQDQVAANQQQTAKTALDAVKSLKQAEAEFQLQGFRDCADCPEMIQIPAGSFRMGGNGDDERPVHGVQIAAFSIGKYDVTFDDWDACAAAGGCSQRPGDAGWGRGTRPVINVGWDDAQQYVKWLSRKTGHTYRLPSEAEWEYAARAGTTTGYWWGDAVGRGKADCDGCGSQWDGKQTAPVGSFAANPWGLYDTLGNVWQWVQDCYQGSYADAPVDGSARESCSGPSSASRVMRGGSWFRDPAVLRAASRGNASPSYRNFNSGFRLARNGS